MNRKRFQLTGDSGQNIEKLSTVLNYLGEWSIERARSILPWNCPDCEIQRVFIGYTAGNLICNTIDAKFVSKYEASVCLTNNIQCSRQVKEFSPYTNERTQLQVSPIYFYTNKPKLFRHLQICFSTNKKSSPWSKHSSGYIMIPNTAHLRIGKKW